MPTIERSALVPYLADDMYNIVVDVAAYPEFLPWCQGGSVQSQNETEQRATVAINAVFSQTEFKTVNALDPGQSISMALEDGPFKHLTGRWEFKPLGDAGCKVTLSIDFEFANTMIASAIAPVFTRVCDTLVDAFIQRANDSLTPLGT